MPMIEVTTAEILVDGKWQGPPMLINPDVYIRVLPTEHEGKVVAFNHAMTVVDCLALTWAEARKVFGSTVAASGDAMTR